MHFFFGLCEGEAERVIYSHGSYRTEVMKQDAHPIAFAVALQERYVVRIVEMGEATHNFTVSVAATKRLPPLPSPSTPDPRAASSILSALELRTTL